MKEVVLCFLMKENEICLALKKRGFGEGKMNGIGGKVEARETTEEAAVRELKEEIGVSAHSSNLEKVGSIDFHFNDNPDWNQRMHIFFVKKWEGEPTESEEMAPVWHNKGDLPFQKMWVDDKHWLPKVLEGKKIKGKFYFNNKGADIDKFEIKEV